MKISVLTNIIASRVRNYSSGLNGVFIDNTNSAIHNSYSSNIESYLSHEKGYEYYIGNDIRYDVDSEGNLRIYKNKTLVGLYSKHHWERVKNEEEI